MHGGLIYIIWYTRYMKDEKNLAALRHSLAHLLGASVKEIYPNAHLTLGPAIDDGFYYDVDFGTDKFTESDLAIVEQKMRDMAKTWTTFAHADTSYDDAVALYSGNPYKTELINEIKEKGEKISLYTSGNFTDLCRGGHIDDFSTIDMAGWKLDRIAGAYWRGNSENKMLTRIYGLAYETKDDLEKEIWRQEEAIKRDHRKLGKELKLYTISDLVGSGLPLFHPRGMVLRQEITNYLWDLHKDHGYQWVWTPHLAKESLYEISGHAGHYLDDMFKVHGGTSKEDFYLKPMNCPHHYQLFADNQWSYRDMPVRYFEPATIYRDEKTGQLAGLARVRSITQDDGHLFVRPNQIQNEFTTIVNIIKEFYGTMGMLDGYWVRLSLRGENKSDYLGSDEVWETAEKALTEVCENLKLNYRPGYGEAAFYGPKLDFMFKDAIGREWQLATIQCDFNAPERFDMSYVNEEGKTERPVVIHRAIAGSLERFLGVAIEHFAGNFPTWMSPVQVAVIPVRENHEDEAEKIYKALHASGVRVEKILGDDSLGKRIHAGKKTGAPYVIVLGDKEIESGMLTIEKRNGEKVQMTIADFTTHIKNEIKDRTNN